MFKLQVTTENSVFLGPTFEPEAAPEIARMLRELADRLERRGLSNATVEVLRDANGNLVGTWDYRP